MELVTADTNLELCGRPTQGDSTCKNRAGYATPHFGKGPCKFHGGALPNVIKHWQEEEAKELASEFGLPIEVEPHTALLAALYESEGHAAFLRMKMEEDDVITTVTIHGENWEKTERHPSVWKNLWDKERQHAAKLAMACIKSGIAERQVALAEQQADMIVSVIMRVFDDPELQLSPSQRETAERVTPLALRSVAG